MSPDIDLAVFTADLVNHLLREDLSAVVMVAHRSVRHATSVPPEDVPERIARLVYLDALVPVSGRAPFDDTPAEVIAQRTRQAEETSGGLSVPPPPAAAFGVNRISDATWLEARPAPPPLATAS